MYRSISVSIAYFRMARAFRLALSAEISEIDGVRPLRFAMCAVKRYSQVISPHYLSAMPRSERCGVMAEGRNCKVWIATDAVRLLDQCEMGPIYCPDSDTFFRNGRSIYEIPKGSGLDIDVDGVFLIFRIRPLVRS